MGKFILIAAALLLLYYFLIRRKSARPTTASPSIQIAHGMQLIAATNKQIMDLSKKTFKLIGIGVILLLITVILGLKIKILLFLLPIALFLIGHLFLMSNHLKYCKDQRLYYRADSQSLQVEALGSQKLVLDLTKDIQRIQLVESIQSTRGVNYGYYKIYTPKGTVYIPQLVAENVDNKLFFDFLTQQHSLEREKRIFPII
ncbi:hypothetical protein J5U18_10415 [Sphingobacteriaceae bacterium WQ 2009]|uniref:Uncharacterized protein n=1 Tax=Rhinopithecimicrobium faecis TaxID=2820698 RepID=A0A8T4HA34_9SPHI|nr:hypothetical protein [Sphingobacteriaceae bacterium WQ 2009]